MKLRQYGENLLPSCTDLLNGVQPRSEVSTTLYLYPSPSGDQKSTLTPAAQWLSDSREQALGRRNSYGGNATSPIQDYRFDNGPRRSSLTSIIEGERSPPLHYPASTYQSPMVYASSNPSVLSPLFLAPPPSPFLPRPGSIGDGCRTPTSAANASKPADSDNHRRNEKKRRDVNCAKVNASEILSRGISPGVIAGCPSCINNEQSPSQKTKKAKNEIVQSTVIFEYQYVLHHCPERLHDKFQEIRELALSLHREKEEGARNAGGDEKKMLKWDMDSRAEVVEDLLAEMMELARVHGFDFSEPQPEARKRKRGVEDGETPTKEKRRNAGGRKALSAPTPPSSAATSPVMGNIRSPGVSPFSSFSSSGDERIHR